MTDALRAASLIVAAEADRLGRGWDYQGIHASVRRALDEDGRLLADVVLAGVAAARDTTAKTPAALRWTTYYPATASGAGPVVAKCDLCGRPETVHALAEGKLHPDQRHEFVAVTR